jgi:hypothetical protein
MSYIIGFLDLTNNSQKEIFLSYVEEFEKLLPKELMDVSYTSPPEIRDFAWNSSDVKKVLACLREKKRIVLGGEVYTKKGSKLDLTWDAWDYHTEIGLSRQENVENAYKTAIEYIEFFSKKLGDDFLYSVVIKPDD